MYTHSHHIIPRHMGGSDHPSNLITLSVHEHAIAHWILFLKYGHADDAIASHGLFKQSGLLLSSPNITEEWREKARARSIAGLAAMSPEKKAEMRRKQSIAAKKRYANMSPEKKEAWRLTLCKKRTHTPRPRPPFSPLYAFCRRDDCSNRVKDRRHKCCSIRCARLK